MYMSSPSSQRLRPEWFGSVALWLHCRPRTSRPKARRNLLYNNVLVVRHGGPAATHLGIGQAGVEFDMVSGVVTLTFSVSGGVSCKPQDRWRVGVKKVGWEATFFWTSSGDNSMLQRQNGFPSLLLSQLCSKDEFPKEAESGDQCAMVRVNTSADAASTCR
jgi:hypothetical protein